ncbi:MAG: TIGR01777 family oxidoreductase [Planctomycetales bacterium]
MKVAVTGSSGLVGSALAPYLTAGGHEVVRIVRRPARGADEMSWDPSEKSLDSTALRGIDAVVHLAGESIAGGRWNAEKKRRIRDSRVDGTRLLAEALAAAEEGPRVFVCASAIGYYGSRGAEILTEASAAGRDFLADVCREWEAAADPARAAGVRVVHLRFGMILDPAGGALAKMLTPFKLGAGGRIGDGRQYWSWIARDDVLDVVLRALTEDDLAGPVNTVSPNPATCGEFTKTLGRVLSRPTIFPMPAFAARLAFGEMADALLLASQRVVPQRLQRSGHRFRHPELEAALRHMLGR